MFLVQLARRGRLPCPVNRTSLVRFKSTTPTDLVCNRTQVTTLSNGIQVASVNSPGHFVALGVYVNTGSKFETSTTSGHCHMLERMAFKSTQNLSSDDIVKQLELAGGNIMGHASRETMMYQASIFQSDVPKILSVFAEIIQRPLFKPDELEEAKMTTMYEIQQVNMQPDVVMDEQLHSVAFRGTDAYRQRSGELVPTGLGRPMMVSEERLPLISSESLHEFHKTWYTPDRIAIVGVGMEHQVLLDLAQKYFGDMVPAAPAIKAKQETAINPVVYSGGFSVIDTKGERLSNNPEDLDLTHIRIAFEGPSAMDSDSYAAHTLTSLMGGGGSFSAGGPGKGMYSRLYQTLLNQWGWIESCHANNLSYNNSGLFVLQASIHPSQDTHKYALDIFCQSLAVMADKLSDEEVHRAKNRLQSSLLMSLESKMTEAEDIGRQILLHGKRMPSSVMVDRINAVTKEDLLRLGRNILYGLNEPPSQDKNYEGDGFTRNTGRVGNGCPSVLVMGSMYKNDSLKNAEQTLARWGFGGVRKPSFKERAMHLFR